MSAVCAAARGAPPPARRQAGQRRSQQGGGKGRPGQAEQRRQPRTEPQDTAQRKNPELYSLTSEGVRPAGSAALHPASGAASGGAPHERPLAAQPAVVTLPRHKPEVLAPAGGWPQLKAAVENGADAVYFGLSDFNARARASNFEPGELPEVMAYLHQRGAKGYAVLNVLVFDEELGQVQERVRQMALAGVDAVIVQDLGVVELIRRVAPGLPIHGSTQMSIVSPEGAQFARQRGVSRIVVGRELSVRDISKVSAGCEAEVEAFVHGALCVSYSGQCYSSEAWGGRSANRGQCAQACRLPYGLIVDGIIRELGDIQYLLSPQDLAAVELVPELIQAGVGCFKIEGRLKGPEYVAATTQVYRRAVDAAWAALTSGSEAGSAAEGAGGAPDAAAPAATAAAAEAGRVQLSDAEWQELQQVFARGQDGSEQGRGLTPGFLEGSFHQRLVRGRSPRHRGNYIGRVQKVMRNTVVLRLEQPVHRGDGLVFDRGDPQQAEEGGSVYDILDARGASLESGAAGATVALAFGRSQLDFAAIRPGDLVWKNSDPALLGRLRSSYEGLAAGAHRRLPVAVAVQARLGAPLRVTLTDEQGNTGSGETEVAAEAASGRPLDAAQLQKAVGQHLGGEAPLAAASWDLSACDLEAGLFVPGGAIKEARRRAVAALLAARQAAARATAEGLQQGDVLAGMLAEIGEADSNGSSEEPAAVETAPALAGAAAGEGNAAAEDGPSTSGRSGPAARAAPVLRVLCRIKAQVDAALALPWLQEVVLDFLEVHGLKEACAAVRAAGRRVVVATPRVLKPDEQRLWLFYLRLGADALLLRSAGLLHHLMELGGPGAAVEGCEHRVPALEGDFSLNAANVLSADLLLRSGLSRLAPTHDCNAAQLQGLAERLGGRAGRLELVLHQHLPIFHTEHCVFCRFLSDGSDYRDCGHPCESHAVHLRDEKGKDHLVLADMGCRNTVFNASAQSGLPFLPHFAAAGFGCFRVELVDEPAEYVAPLLEGYRKALQAATDAAASGSGTAAGWQSAQELWRWMQSLPDANGRAHGVGLGSLEVTAERNAAAMKPTAASLR
ncbi:hypothetical protein ABPG75_006779 [Micractinium tetrahymenae]